LERAYGFSVFEDNERWDRLDTESSGEIWGIVDVDFGDDRFAFLFSGDLFNDGAKHLTWSTPFGPEVH
jgi:hypothetical protein